MEKRFYRPDQEERLISRIDRISEKLPEDMKKFLISRREQGYDLRSVLEYAYDLDLYCYYLEHKNENNIPDPEAHPLQNETAPLNELIYQADKQTILDYLLFLKAYQRNGKEYRNSSSGQYRKLSALRAFYRIFGNENPTAEIPNPSLQKTSRRATVRYDAEKILDEIHTQKHLTPEEKRQSSRTIMRDTAIILVIADTGMGVSACSGLDVSDIDLKQATITASSRKAKEKYEISDQTIKALSDYIMFERWNPEDFSDALFVSKVLRRMTPRSIQRMIHKFAGYALPGQTVTPQTIRMGKTTEKN